MSNFKKSPLAAAVLIASTVAITGCQSTPTTAVSTATPSTLTPSQNAHRLMTDMMIHRFDKAYDFEKTTQYHAYPLYAENDIEKNDQSLWFTLLKNYADKKSKKYDSDTAEATAESDSYTQAAEKCLDEYSTEIDKLEQQSSKGKISSKNYGKKLEKIGYKYEQCLDAIPESPSSAAANAAMAVATAPAKETKSETIEDSNITPTPADEPTPSKYQIMVKAMIEKLNALDAKNMDVKKLDSKPNQEHPNTAETSAGDETTEDEQAQQDIVTMFKNLKLTPQQIQVLNDSYLAPHSLSYKGSYNPSSNQYSTVFEESLHRPFVDTYRRVPVLVDFNEMSITAEPDVVLPLIGIFSLFGDDKKTSNPLAQLEGKSVKFTLSNKLKQKIPLPLLKDTLIKSIGKSYADLPSERFSDVALDEYAKSIHANRAVKLNLTHQDIGYLFGRSMKYWANELNTVTTQHPEYLENREDFKASLDLLNALNRHYRADDVAKIAQIIEAILPLSYNGYNYYYFDSQNNLIGYRKNTEYSSSLFRARVTSTTTSKLSYGKNAQNSHTYYQPKSSDIIDGNTLVRQLRDDSKLRAEVESARWSYPTEDSEKTKNNAYAAQEAVNSVLLEQARKLKFTKKTNCKNFADKNKETLRFTYTLRNNDNFKTDYPAVAKFEQACPIQAKTFMAAADAYLAAQHAAASIAEQ